jgi:hypothetical protein
MIVDAQIDEPIVQPGEAAAGAHHQQGSRDPSITGISGRHQSGSSPRNALVNCFALGSFPLSSAGSRG